MVYHSEHIGAASEAEVKASCDTAGGRLVQYHPKIGTVLAASASRDFAEAVLAQVMMLTSAPSLDASTSSLRAPHCNPDNSWPS